MLQIVILAAFIQIMIVAEDVSKAFESFKINENFQKIVA